MRVSENGKVAGTDDEKPRCCCTSTRDDKVCLWHEKERERGGRINWIYIRLTRNVADVLKLTDLSVTRLLFDRPNCQSDNKVRK